MLSEPKINNYLKENRIDNIHHHFEDVRTVSNFLKETKYLASRTFFQLSKAFNNTFRYNSMSIPYFYHRYNMTWLSERTIELPIALIELEKFHGKSILEIGNVLSHYRKTSHDIVDLYESGPGIKNVDIVDYIPTKKYEFICSLSTFEHMGFDEEKKDPLKPSRALLHIIDSCLKPGGSIFLTFPLGYNPHLDESIKKNPWINGQLQIMKRISRMNSWIESNIPDVSGLKYDSKFPFANAIGIWQYTKRNELST